MNRRLFLASGAAALAACSSGTIPPVPRPGLPWNALAKQLAGRVVLPGDTGFAALALPNNLRYASRMPAGIALCETTQDVSASILWARENGVPLVARSGGHSYAGYSTTTGLMIDVRRMTSFQFDASTGALKLGGGARNLTVFKGCRPLDIAIPHGRCFQVGVAGLGLGGGVGFNMRPNGLTGDAILQTEIVTADGKVHAVDANNDPDLYWACRGGGGGNFGINTSFTFETFAVAPISACELYWNGDLENVFSTLVATLEDAPDTLGSKVSLNVSYDAKTGKPKMQVQLLAQYEGSKRQLLEILMPVYGVRIPDEIVFFNRAPYWIAQELLSEAGLPAYYQERSRFFNQRFTSEAVSTVFDWARRWPATTHAAAFKVFQTGGKVNAIPPSATAFVHRNSWWLSSIEVSWSATTTPAQLQRALDWQAGYYDAIIPIAGGGAYQNFIDPSLQDWQQAYYGANLPRLEAVKRRVDPDRVFRFPEAIP